MVDTETETDQSFSEEREAIASPEENLQAEINSLRAKRDELIEKLKAAKALASEWEKKYHDLKSGVRTSSKSVEARIEELEQKLLERDRQLESERRKQTIISQLSAVDDLASIQDFIVLYSAELESEELDLDVLVKSARRDRPYLFKAVRGSGTKPSVSAKGGTEKATYRNKDEVTLAYKSGLISLAEAQRLIKEMK
jgi:chromosome segregation ATPase